jgi:hypothetical protein
LEELGSLGDFAVRDFDEDIFWEMATEFDEGGETVIEFIDEEKDSYAE